VHWPHRNVGGCGSGDLTDAAVLALAAGYHALTTNNFVMAEHHHAENLNM
jgi:hypothetical protein